jgi:hypothetical protein
MQKANAYEWRGRIFVHAFSRTSGDGPWVLSPPVLAADSRDPAALGRAILSALAGSKKGVPHPSNWDDLSAPLMKLTGAKSRSAFDRSARSVGIKYQDGHVTFTPKRNFGVMHGFKTLEGKVRISLPDVTELGATLLAAFEDAE